MAKQINTVDTSTENTEVTDVANAPIGSVQEALKKRIVELETQVKTLEAEIVIHKNVAKEQAEEIEALKSIQATQDEALANTPKVDKIELLRFDLLKQGLNLVEHNGKYYSTVIGNYLGTPIANITDEQKEYLLKEIIPSPLVEISVS